MRITYDTFYDRVREIDLYFMALMQLYDTQNTFDDQYEFHSDEFLKILKANALLMIYNLVESTIMGGILEIYDRFKEDGLTYLDVRQEIKNIWFLFKFSQVYDKSAHYNSYKDKAFEIVNSILNDEVIEMDRKATDISGNLDADKIRIICSKHGISYQVDNSCRGGEVLKDVKNKRNDLAHGTISFAECGREYSPPELEKIKNETQIFLEGILDGMKKYYDEKIYLYA